MNQRTHHRVLFVAYQFPPVGGVGVHRVTKFVKYLPQFGWNSSVLTVSNPSVPLIDQSLLTDIPPGTVIRRAKTFEPGYKFKTSVSGGNGQPTASPWKQKVKSAVRHVGNLLLQPDAQVLWHPHAYRQGLKLLKDLHHDAIVATGPPFSSFLLGARLAEASGLPLMLDYRDEWDISNAYWENKSQGRISHWIQRRQQCRALRAADMILATTPSSAKAISQLAWESRSDASATWIYNGFDPDDFPRNVAMEKRDYGHGTERFRLAFIGTLWNLNSIEPVVTALQRLNESSPQLASHLELLLAGRRTGEQEQIVDRLSNTAVAVSQLPFVDHQEAVQLMRSSDSLLMINSDLPKTQRIINAKTFEYMAARKPMFVVAPKGDVWDIVRELPGSVLCEPANLDELCEQLALQIEQHRCGVEIPESHWKIEGFHRRQLAGELAELLGEMVQHASQTPTGLKLLTNAARRGTQQESPQ